MSCVLLAIQYNCTLHVVASKVLILDILTMYMNISNHWVLYRSVPMVLISISSFSSNNCLLCHEM